MNIQEKIQQILLISGLTQTKLADKLGVSFPTLSSWINGRSTPRVEAVKNIDNLYLKITGIKISGLTAIESKTQILKLKQKANKNIIEFIKSRKDIYDEITLHFTYNTNSIEGSTMTVHDTAAVIFDNVVIKNKHLTEHLEAKNHQTAINYMFKKVHLGFEITEDFILNLHYILMSGIRDDAGAYRNHGVRIVGANMPTANYVKVPVLMKEVIEKINKDNPEFLLHIAKIHSEFEKIHPFSDGNGRVGRLIMATMLLSKNYPPAIIKQKTKQKYYKYLQKSQQKNEHIKLTEFVCDAVINGFSLLD